jgi:hypothetical protein
MNSHQTRLAVIILLLTITGCIKKEKDELTLPGKIMLKLSIADHGNDVSPIIWGYAGIKSIRFEGKRDAGEDVFFETNPETIFPTLDIRTGGYISDFDIPRGVYNYMKIDIDLKRIVTAQISDNELDSLNIGLVFIGHYYFEYGVPDPPLPVFYTIDDTVKLSFRSEANQKFVLSDEESGVSLLLDPFSVLELVGQDVIENLEPSGHPGHQIILISSTNNKAMHDYLMSQISQTARIIF